jgi:hypothetical protein
MTRPKLPDFWDPFQDVVDAYGRHAEPPDFRDSIRDASDAFARHFEENIDPYLIRPGGGATAEPPTPPASPAPASHKQPGRKRKPPGQTVGERRLAMLEQNISMERIAEIEGEDIEVIRRSLDRGRARRQSGGQ